MTGVNVHTAYFVPVIPNNGHFFLVRRALENPVHFKFIRVFVKFLSYMHRTMVCKVIFLSNCCRRAKRRIILRAIFTADCWKYTRFVCHRVSSRGGWSPEMHSTDKHTFANRIAVAGRTIRRKRNSPQYASSSRCCIIWRQQFKFRRRVCQILWRMSIKSERAEIRKGARGPLLGKLQK